MTLKDSSHQRKPRHAFSSERASSELAAQNRLGNEERRRRRRNGHGPLPYGWV